MTPDDWQKLSPLLDQALDLTDVERVQFLDKLRDEDPRLCREVESLLEQRNPTDLFEGPPSQLLKELPTSMGGSTHSEIPKQLGAYRIVKILGAGGMGVVYEAEDPTLQRSVALKVMKQEHALSSQARERFLREARAAAALQHDHILPIYHVGDEGGVVFLVMPLLQGETLEDRLRRTPTLSTEQILRIGREIAEGLAAAHGRGLIHRDIKPANLWLEAGRDRVKIMDFGLARPIGEVDGHLTQSGMILGTPAYVAPEQGRGEEVDGRAALFSLGCVLYRMGAGAPPFQRKDPLSTIVAAATETPASPRQINQAIPASVSDLILKLLAKAPADRPQSASEVVDRVTDLELAMLRSAPDTSSLARPQALRPIRQRPKFRHWALGSAAVLIALVIFGVVYAIRFSTPTENPLVEIPDKKPPAQPVQTEPATAPLSTKEWLVKKTKEQILTVAQDGSGMFKTIGAALDALEPGQAIKVLDKGPYREQLQKALPEDVGIISDVGTRIELPGYTKRGPDSERKDLYTYVGSRLYCSRGLRLAGFEFVVPVAPADANNTRGLDVSAIGDVVVENCRFLHTPPFGATPPGAEGRANIAIRAIHIYGQAEASLPTRVLVADNHVEGSVCFDILPAQIFLERNWIINWVDGGVAVYITLQQTGEITIRHNIIHAHASIGFRNYEPRDKELPRAKVAMINNLFDNFTNNLFDSTNNPVNFWPMKNNALLSREVRAQNNIFRMRPAFGGVALPLKDLAEAMKHWHVGYNCYLTQPPKSNATIPLQSNDVVTRNPFLSSDPTHADYLRIAADGPLATGGVGGDLPEYIGPLPPGPPPKDGDWFTRLLSAK